MYKLVLAFDVHNETGESLIKQGIPNTAEYSVTKEEAENINISLAVERIITFLAHYYSLGFQDGGPCPQTRGAFPEVLPYSYTLGLPRGAALPRQYHSNIAEKHSNDPYKPRVYPGCQFLETDDE